MSNFAPIFARDTGQNSIAAKTMKRFAAYLIVILMGLQAAFAQQSQAITVEGVAEFDKTAHDFGDFLLSDGPKSCTFTVKNVSDRAFAILTVVSSCGCTDVQWQKKPVKPGETAIISATYSNDQGAYPFEKTLTVYVSSLTKPVILRLRGNVTEKKKPLAETFPVHIGRLGMKDTEFKLGNLSQGGQRSDFTLIANLGKTPLKLSFSGVSSGLSVRTDPETIGPGETGKLIYTVTASREIWGKNWYYLTPVVDGKAGKRIGIWAFTKEDFTGWTKEQKENGAQPMAKASTYSFGIVKAGKKIDAVFDITNQGKSPLIIYKVDSDSPAAVPAAFGVPASGASSSGSTTSGSSSSGIPASGASSSGSTTSGSSSSGIPASGASDSGSYGSLAPGSSYGSLAPGASTKLHVSLDTKGLPKGEFMAIITLTTNAPLRPIVNLFISGAITD